MPMRVAPLQAEDIPQCEAVLRSLPEWFGIEAANREYIARLGRYPAFVARDDAGVVGFQAIREHNAESAELYVLAVAPDRHRQGSGRRLVEHAERWLRDRGVRVLHVLTLAPSNPDPYYARTRAFYAALGFTPLFETNKLWGEDNPTLVLVKQL